MISFCIITLILFLCSTITWYKFYFIIFLPIFVSIPISHCWWFLHNVLNNLFCIPIYVILLVWSIWPFFFWLSISFTTPTFLPPTPTTSSKSAIREWKVHSINFTKFALPKWYNLSVRFLSKQNLFLFCPAYYTRSLSSIHLLLCDFSNFSLSLSFEFKTCS